MKSSFDEEFRLKLEYHLGKVFEKSNAQEYKSFWCDGIGMPMPKNQLSKKYVNDHRNIITKAWVGNTGQDEYEMKIHFGRYALRRYARGQSIIDCIPEDESMDWLEIDTKYRTIEIWLK